MMGKDNLEKRPSIDGYDENVMITKKRNENVPNAPRMDSKDRPKYLTRV